MSTLVCFFVIAALGVVVITLSTKLRFRVAAEREARRAAEFEKWRSAKSEWWRHVEDARNVKKGEYSNYTEHYALSKFIEACWYTSRGEP